MRRIAKTLCLPVLLGACDPAPGPEQGPPADDELEAALEEYCEETGECGDGKQDLFGVVVATKIVWTVLADLVTRNISFDWIEDNWCAMPDRFVHFVDYAARENGRPSFTSVQDFEIRRTDIEAEDVLAQFKGDWLLWWDNGGTVDATTGAPGPGLWHQQIRPIGISAVDIVMDVHDHDPPVHPKLRHPELDTLRGESLQWDVGLRIDMTPGNAFDGTMYVLARKTSRGIHVREIWYDTEPVSPLVMKVVPFVFRLSDEETLAIPPALHIMATEGCVPTAENSGYPGLIEKFEDGTLP
jgi:hypothetical protein